MTATTDSDSTRPDSSAKATAVLEEEGASSGARPSFTITEAASACAVSRKTITRKLAELAEAGAAKDADGIWRIPVEALLSVGLHPGRSLTPGSARREPVVDLRSARPAPVEHAQAPETITVPRDRWDDMRIRLARAEAESTERGRALEDARLALRALTAGPASMSVPMMDPSANVASAPWESPTNTASRNDPVGSARTAAESGAYEASGTVPGPVPGLPPTPVPRSLAADSAVWDTLLPRAAAAATGATVGTQGGNGAANLSGVESADAGAHIGKAPSTATFDPHPGHQFGQPVATAQAPAPGQVVTPRRRWWGGKR